MQLFAKIIKLQEIAPQKVDVFKIPDAYLELI